MRGLVFRWQDFDGPIIWCAGYFQWIPSSFILALPQLRYSQWRVNVVRTCRSCWSEGSARIAVLWQPRSRVGSSEWPCTSHTAGRWEPCSRAHWGAGPTPRGWDLRWAGQVALIWELVAEQGPGLLDKTAEEIRLSSVEYPWSPIFPCFPYLCELNVWLIPGGLASSWVGLTVATPSGWQSWEFKCVSQFEQKAGNSVEISQLALALLLHWPLCEGTQLARLSVRLCGSWVISVYSRDMLRRITSLILETIPYFRIRWAKQQPSVILLWKCQLG